MCAEETMETGRRGHKRNIDTKVSAQREACEKKRRVLSEEGKRLRLQQLAKRHAPNRLLVVYGERTARDLLKSVPKGRFTLVYNARWITHRVRGTIYFDHGEEAGSRISVDDARWRYSIVRKTYSPRVQRFLKGGGIIIDDESEDWHGPLTYLRNIHRGAAETILTEAGHLCRRVVFDAHPCVVAPVALAVEFEEELADAVEESVDE